MRLKRHSRLTALLLTLLALPMILPLPPAHAESKTGTVRVLLTKLNLTDRIELSLDGSYSLNGIAFQRGSKLTVSCAGGTLMVYYEGMALDAGKQMTLLRHAVTDNAENGFRVNGAYPLHPGNLVLSVQGGQLRAVLHAPVEEYLLGVVPSEMSDTFPLEALKAQAVAARTYALRKAALSITDYDVQDNTNDQAYNGVKAENVNAAKAVQETRGLCCFYKDGLGQCYYTASNGGQTELGLHAWNKGDDDGPLKMADDPYDVENPLSKVAAFSIPRSPANWQALGALEPFVRGAVAEPAEALGYDPDQIQPVRVADVQVTDSKYPGTASKIMTKLRMTVTVAGTKITEPEAEEELSIFSTSPLPTAAAARTSARHEDSVSIALDIFPELEKALALSINGSANELISVRETENAYVLESRRYGHGVGMSQRGAEQMAGAHAWTFDQILRFYYPGMTIGKLDSSYAMPSPINAAFLSTPAPAATPTPRPTAHPVKTTPGPQEFVVWVTNIAENSYLNLRSQSNAQSQVLEQLYYGQQLIVEKDLGDWLQVRTDEKSGFVMKEFVSTEKAKP